MSTHPLNRPAIQPLVAGYQQFKQKHILQSDKFAGLVEHGQKPKVLAIACSDSRVDPAIVTNSQPGDLFVVRNIANLVPPFESDRLHHSTSAALEFGVLGLEVTDIIVLGHSHCGGIKALMGGEGDSDFIHAWMDIAQPAKADVLTQYPDSSSEEQTHYCEKASLLRSLNNLMTFPWIRERVEKKQLFLHAWYFDLDSGTVEAYDISESTFVSLDSFFNEESCGFLSGI